LKYTRYTFLLQTLKLQVFIAFKQANKTNEDVPEKQMGRAKYPVL